ncbi:Uncharacterised protein [Salmonella enterica subsp. arizonae]|nr:Uncharacterised protein [Salmonella enterica subsp. arizonae]
MALPVNFVQRGDPNFLTAAWRLDKLTVADINTNVIGGSASLCTEENQIAVFQFATRNGRSVTQVIHLIRRSGDTDLH